MFKEISLTWLKSKFQIKNNLQDIEETEPNILGVFFNALAISRHMKATVVFLAKQKKTMDEC